MNKIANVLDIVTNHLNVLEHNNKLEIENEKHKHTIKVLKSSLYDALSGSNKAYCPRCNQIIYWFGGLRQCDSCFNISTHDTCIGIDIDWYDQTDTYLCTSCKFQPNA